MTDLTDLTDIEIIRQLRLQHEQLRLIISCIVNAVDHRDDPGASELFHEAVAAGRGMIQ